MNINVDHSHFENAVVVSGGMKMGCLCHRVGMCWEILTQMFLEMTMTWLETRMILTSPGIMDLGDLSDHWSFPEVGNVVGRMLGPQVGEAV